MKNIFEFLDNKNKLKNIEKKVVDIINEAINQGCSYTSIVDDLISVANLESTGIEHRKILNDKIELLIPLANEENRINNAIDRALEGGLSYLTIIEELISTANLESTSSEKKAILNAKIEQLRSLANAEVRNTQNHHQQTPQTQPNGDVNLANMPLSQFENLIQGLINSYKREGKDAKFIRQQLINLQSFVHSSDEKLTKEKLNFLEVERQNNYAEIAEQRLNANNSSRTHNKAVQGFSGYAKIQSFVHPDSVPNVPGEAKIIIPTNIESKLNDLVNQTRTRDNQGNQHEQSFMLIGVCDEQNENIVKIMDIIYSTNHSSQGTNYAHFEYSLMTTFEERLNYLKSQYGNNVIAFQSHSHPETVYSDFFSLGDLGNLINMAENNYPNTQIGAFLLAPILNKNNQPTGRYKKCASFYDANVQSFYQFTNFEITPQLGNVIDSDEFQHSR